MYFDRGSGDNERFWRLGTVIGLSWKRSVEVALREG